MTDENQSFSGLELTAKEQALIDQYKEECVENRCGFSEHCDITSREHDDIDFEKLSYEIAAIDLDVLVPSLFFYHANLIENGGDYEEDEELAQKAAATTKKDVAEIVAGIVEGMLEEARECRKARAERRAERVAKGLPPEYTEEEIKQMQEEARASFKRWQAEEAAKVLGEPIEAGKPIRKPTVDQVEKLKAMLNGGIQH